MRVEFPHCQAAFPEHNYRRFADPVPFTMIEGLNNYLFSRLESTKRQFPGMYNISERAADTGNQGNICMRVKYGYEFFQYPIVQLVICQ